MHLLGPSSTVNSATVFGVVQLPRLGTAAIEIIDITSPWWHIYN